ncbi:Vmc-like lipoprotein signal peptide domain-containing protein [Mycolicibacterium cosmeticum]|uniref:Uncharacterized protein n=1 Tax=Mycolicibacterium cosmeticum TaxID=258533 RepID=W9BIN7_MYCCO|nr:hypothetical protein [Mycolicibacterium cosmeticum]CDO06640.1 hypothetical protein BN977_01433 [Mycolicibacterium cosmeticum]
MTQPPPPPNGSWNPGPGGWPQGYPGGQPGPQWNPQQGWPQTPPPQKRGFAKWIIGGVALVGVIAVTAVVAVSCTKSSGGSDKPTAAPTTSGASTSDFASANDTGPVSVITEDPSCAPWMPILTTFANSTDEGWKQRDPSIPADLWSTELRSQYQSAAQAMRTAADQTVPLTKLTNHRVMRELYEQFIAYARAYADRIRGYTPQDDRLAVTAVTTTEVLSNICQAITYGSAAARAPLTTPAQPPTSIAPVGNPNDPQRFLIGSETQCKAWSDAMDAYSANTAINAWLKIDPNIPASQLTPEQKAQTDAAVPVLQSFAEQLADIGSQSENPTFQDFAILASQYKLAYISAIPTLVPSDNYLYDAGRYIPGVIRGACESSGS